VPTVLRVGGLRFFFYANEGSEPPHVHVQSADGAAKYWLEPVAIARSAGYDAHELTIIRSYVEAHLDELRQAWHEFHNR
jgi:hypothetical protein